jgi:hypothetical protein
MNAGISRKLSFPHLTFDPILAVLLTRTLLRMQSISTALEKYRLDNILTVSQLISNVSLQNQNFPPSVKRLYQYYWEAEKARKGDPMFLREASTLAL